MEFKPYDPKAIEPKWQKRWADSHVFEAKNDYTMPKFYGLIEFPYPSGQGLHVGHPRSNTAMDIIARKRRMEGCNVLSPSAGTPSVCRRRTTPSRTRFIPPS